MELAIDELYKPTGFNCYGELYACLEKIAHIDCLVIKQSIVQNNKNYTSLDSPTHKEYKNLCLVSLENQDKSYRHLFTVR